MTDNNLLELLKVKSVAELYCELSATKHQLNFLKKFNPGDSAKELFYMGFNTDDNIIAHNRQFYRLDKSKFFATLNAVHDPIPTCDLLILNNFFTSLSVAEIWLLLTNIKESGATYFMVNDHASDHIHLTQTPFYLPKPEMVVSIKDPAQHFSLYKLKDIAFLLDYAEDEDALLRSQAYPLMKADFATLHDILGDVLFTELVRTFKMGWQASVEFMGRKNVQDLFKKYCNLGFQLRAHYYRILFRKEFEAVTQVWPFFNEGNHFKFYLIFLNYLNSLVYADLAEDEELT